MRQIHRLATPDASNRPQNLTQCDRTKSEERFERRVALEHARVKAWEDIRIHRDVEVDEVAGCAVRVAGGITCWWRSADRADDPVNVFPVAGLPGVRVQAVDRGRDAGCALLEDGTVWCFRLDTREVAAVRVTGVPAARALSVGGMVCVTTDASPYCWGTPGGDVWPGDGTRIEFGVNETGDPVALKQTKKVASMSVAGNHVCVVDQAGSVRCWGSIFDGQSVGRRLPSASPLRVSLPAQAKFLAVRESFSFAGLEDDRVFCWESLRDQRTCRAVATEVPSFRGASMVCVLRRSGAVDCTQPEDPNGYAALPGEVYCWLSNEGDALADGPGCQIGQPTVVDLDN